MQSSREVKAEREVRKKLISKNLLTWTIKRVKFVQEELQFVYDFIEFVNSPIWLIRFSGHSLAFEFIAAVERLSEATSEFSYN